MTTLETKIESLMRFSIALAVRSGASQALGYPLVLIESKRAFFGL